MVDETVDLPSAIFRAYDIRGVVGEELTPNAVELIARAIGSIASEQGLQTFNVSRDDLYEIQVVFDQARQRFIRVNRDIHDVFRLKRREMPGG